MMVGIHILTGALVVWMIIYRLVIRNILVDIIIQQSGGPSIVFLHMVSRKGFQMKETQEVKLLARLHVLYKIGWVYLGIYAVICLFHYF
jgi:hypothetical protein